MRQRDQELELLLFSKQLGNFPVDINVNELALDINIRKEKSLQTQTAIGLLREPKKKRKKTVSSNISTKIQRDSTNSTKFDLWFKDNHLKIEPHLSNKTGNCLFESVSDWKGKPIELRYKSLLWAKTKYHRGPNGD
jgi:hypothetical protein